MPLQKLREAALDREEDARAKYEADYAALPADAPLWEIVKFLETRNITRQAEILER